MSECLNPKTISSSFFIGMRISALRVLYFPFQHDTSSPLLISGTSAAELPWAVKVSKLFDYSFTTLCFLPT